VLYQALRKHFGVWIGALISSLIFGALHGEISIAGATFVMGLVLVYFFEISGSIWPSVLIHVLNNSLKLVAIYIMLAFGININ
ncbi:MAG: CPBP family intramembrane metalloprotease, partial [Anaerolineales bacterium]